MNALCHILLSTVPGSSSAALNLTLDGLPPLDYPKDGDAGKVIKQTY